MHIYINEFNLFDHRKMLINFALTGYMDQESIKIKNDPFFGGKKCCTLWILLNHGTIKKIFGLKELENDPSIIFILKRFKEGEKILEIVKSCHIALRWMNAKQVPQILNGGRHKFRHRLHPRHVYPRLLPQNTRT